MSDERPHYRPGFLQPRTTANQPNCSHDCTRECTPSINPIFSRVPLIRRRVALTLWYASRFTFLMLMLWVARYPLY